MTDHCTLCPALAGRWGLCEVHVKPRSEWPDAEPRADRCPCGADVPAGRYLCPACRVAARKILIKQRPDSRTLEAGDLLVGWQEVTDASR